MNPLANWGRRLGPAALLLGTCFSLQGCFTQHVLSQAHSEMPLETPKVARVFPDGSVTLIAENAINNIMTIQEVYSVKVPHESIAAAVREGQDPPAIRWAQLPGVTAEIASDSDVRRFEKDRPYKVLPENNEFGPLQAIPIEIDGEPYQIKLDHDDARVKRRNPWLFATLPLAVAADTAFPFVMVGAAGLYIVTAPIWVPLTL